jgi:hypothetical protein
MTLELVPPPNPYSYVRRIDLRDLPADGVYPRTRVRRGKTVMRDPQTIDGIVIHQTAMPIPPGKHLLARFPDDPEMAAAHRAYRAASHVTALRRGVAVLTRPLLAYVHHGNGFNARSLGIEIEGSYPGVETQPKKTTWGGNPQEVTDEVVETARDALSWLVEEAAAQNIKLRYVWAHRQASPSRRSDPGSELWRRVVLEHCVPVLGLETQPLLTLRSTSRKAPGWGRKIPLAWDPAGEGAY